MTFGEVPPGAESSGIPQSSGPMAGYRQRAYPRHLQRSSHIHTSSTSPVNASDLIDTDWAIHYLNGHSAIVNRLQELARQGLGIAIVS